MLLYINQNLEVINILRENTSIDEIHAYSIDESCLDITESKTSAPSKKPTVINIWE